MRWVRGMEGVDESTVRKHRRLDNNEEGETGKQVKNRLQSGSAKLCLK